jgi:hypothetical protein
VAGKFKSEYDKENNIISTPLLVKDIQYILTSIQPWGNCGVKHFRFNICYQYGINNAGKSEL